MGLSRTELIESAQKRIQKGQWEEAVELMEAAHAADKGDPIVTLRLGDLYKKLGNNREAANFYFKTANLYADAGEDTKAAATYKMILRIDPSLTKVQEKLDALMARHAQAASHLGAGAGAAAAQPAIELSSPPPSAVTKPEIYYSSSVAAAEQTAEDVEHEMIPGLVEIATDVSLPEPEAPKPEQRPVAVSKETKGAVESYGLNRESGRQDKGADLDEGLVGGTAFALDTEPPKPSGGIFDDFARDALLPHEAAIVFETPVVGATRKRKEAKFLQDLDEEELWDLLGRMDRLTFGPGEAIIREGDTGDSIYIISDGRVGISTTKNGIVIKLAELGEHDFFGEVSFLTGKPRTADVTAIETTSIMELSRSQMDELIQKYPNVENILKMFQKDRVKDTIATIQAVSSGLF